MIPEGVKIVADLDELTVGHLRFLVCVADQLKLPDTCPVDRETDPINETIAVGISIGSAGL